MTDMGITRLKSAVRFRKEKDYVLLCDCATLNNYELPLRLFEFLTRLEQGCAEESITADEEMTALQELRLLQLIENAVSDNVSSQQDVWHRLTYTENEFFV